MKKPLVILIVILGVFLAIGCAESGDQGGEAATTPAEEGTPEQAVTAVEEVTGVEAETPVEEVVAVTEVVEETPVTAVTPAENYTETSTAENASTPADQNATKVLSNTERKKAMIQQTPVEDNESEGKVITVTPNTGS